MPSKKPYTIKPVKRRKPTGTNPAVHRRDAYAGIDFAEDWHDYVVVDAYGEVVAEDRISNDVPGIGAMVAALRPFGTPTLPIPVAIEGNDDLIVQALHDAGFPVIMIPPFSVNAARGTYDVNHSKTDRLDAALLANMVRINQSHWLPRLPAGEATQALRIAARAEKDEGQRARKLAQQMRSLLRNGFPAILNEFDTKELADPKMVSLLRDVPNPTVARALTTEDWERVLKKAGRCQKRAVKAQRLFDYCTAPSIIRPPSVEAAFSDRLMLLVNNLEAALKALKKAEETVQDLWVDYPYAELFDDALNFSPRIGARIFSEIGDDPTLFPRPRKLLAYSGYAPVPHNSGKRDRNKIRKAYNRFLHQGVWDWLQAGHNNQAPNEGMVAHFRYRRDVFGDTGPQAYRNTGARIVKAIWHCLHTGQTWDDEKVWPHLERHLRALDVMPHLTLSEAIARNNADRKAAYRAAAIRAGIR